MEQLGASLINWPAQIKIMKPNLRIPPDPQAAAGPGQVGLQWHGRHTIVDRTQCLSDHKVVRDVADRQLITVAEHCPSRFGNLRQSGQRSAAQAGQRFGEPDSLDDVCTGHRKVPNAQCLGNLRQPAHDWLIWSDPEMVVPAGRGNAGSIASG